MQSTLLLGLILLAMGAVMLYFGYSASQGLGEQVHETFTGRFTESTTWYFVIGLVAAIGGIAMVVLGSRG